jgi:hypothetical protein
MSGGDFGSDRTGMGGTGVTGRHPGPGMGQTFHCDKCQKPRQLLGRQRYRRGAILMWACHECKVQAPK